MVSLEPQSIPPSTSDLRRSATADAGVPAPAIFTDLTIAVIEGPNLDAETASKIYRGVKSRGASVITPNPDGRLPDIRQCSHVIATDIDFPQYGDAIDNMVAVVSPSWASHSVARKRAVNPRPYSPDPRHFFRDVYVLFVGISLEHQKQLELLVLGMGGQVMNGMTRTVTHVVAHSIDQLGDTKGIKPQVELVKPSWITASFAFGARVHTNSHPGHSLRPSQEVNSTPEKGREVNAIRGKTVYLSSDLELSSDLTNALKTIFQQSGCKLNKTMDASVDIFIGKFRDGSPYSKASKSSNVTIGSLTWLVQVISFDKYRSPLSRLLHYPIPRDGIPGFTGLNICLSNYVGDARIYLEQLIVSCGAEFTKNMSSANTHLIAHVNTSEKCQAAVAWNVKLVNHRWLEESYGRCQKLDENDPRFQEFPVLGLDDLVGQRKLDLEEVKRLEQESQADSRMSDIGEPPQVDDSMGSDEPEARGGDLHNDRGALSTSHSSRPPPPSSPPELPMTLQRNLETRKVADKKRTTKEVGNLVDQLIDVDEMEPARIQKAKTGLKKTVEEPEQKGADPDMAFLTPQTARMTTYKGSRSSKASAPKATPTPKSAGPKAKPKGRGSLEAQKNIDEEPEDGSDLSDMSVPTVPKGRKALPSKPEAREAVGSPIKRPRAALPRSVGEPSSDALEPPPSTGRAAKQKALLRVSACAADMNEYAKEQRRHGGPGALERRKPSVDMSPSVAVKRKKASVSDVTGRDGDYDDDDDVIASPMKPQVKRAKATSTAPPISHKLMLTMSDRWTDNPSREKADKAKLRSVGISVTESPSDATILCAPKLVRTKKFVCALASAPAVVSPEYLEACLEFGIRVDPSEYQLQDPEGEAKFGIVLDESLRRARRNRRKLMKGLQIFCTDGVRGGWETYRDVVAANGGVCRLYHGREELRVTRRAMPSSGPSSSSLGGARSSGTEKGEQDQAMDGTIPGDAMAEEDHDNAVYLLSGTTPNERKIWEKFKTMAAGAEMDARICSVDWILSAAMKQQLHWGSEWDLEKAE